MSLGSHRTRLATITRELSNQWQVTKDQWRDLRCRDFEHEYIEDLLTSMEKAGPVIEELDKLVTRIRRECE